MCNVETYNVDDLDCSNYCGTVDEECNSTFVDASCSDVGCGVSGVPTCTNLCRLNYTSCPYEDSKISFELNLQTDNKGSETSWEIRDGSSQIIQSTAYRNNASIEEFYCLNKESCYTFELLDTGGDGICCSETDILGNYTVSVNGSVLPDTNPNFGSSIIHEFGSCSTSEPSLSASPSTKPAARAPSPKPSPKPSSLPTSISSTIPSLNPSSKPSSLPTSIFSTVPSLNPSNRPSANPTPYPQIAVIEEFVDILGLSIEFEDECSIEFIECNDQDEITSILLGKFSF